MPTHNLPSSQPTGVMSSSGHKLVHAMLLPDQHCHNKHILCTFYKRPSLCPELSCRRCCDGCTQRVTSWIWWSIDGDAQQQQAKKLPVKDRIAHLYQLTYNCCCSADCIACRGCTNSNNALLQASCTDIYCGHQHLFLFWVLLLKFIY